MKAEGEIQDIDFINLTSVSLTPVTKDLAAVLPDQGFPTELNGLEEKRVSHRLCHTLL